MADFGVNSTTLTDAQGAGAQPLAPVREEAINTFPTNVLREVGEAFSYGVKQLVKDEAEKRKTSVVGEYTKDIARINDALATGQMKPHEAAARTRMINSKYAAGYPEYIKEIKEASGFLKETTEIGQAEQREREAIQIRNDDLKAASQMGYTIPPNSGPDYENKVIDAYKAARRMELDFERNTKRSAELRAQASEGRQQATFDQQIHDRQVKEQSQKALVELGAMNMDNFGNLGMALSKRTDLTDEQKLAYLTQDYSRIVGSLNAMSMANPEMATPWRKLFDDINDINKQLINSKNITADQAAKLENEWRIKMNTAKLLSIQDPKVYKAAVASELFKDNPGAIALNNMPAVVGWLQQVGFGPETAKNAPPLINSPEQKATLETFRVSLGKLQTGNVDDKVKATGEAINVANRLMKEVNDVGITLKPEEMKTLSAFYSSAEFGKLASEGKLDRESMANAKKVFQMQYEPAVIEAVMNKLKGVLPAGDSNPTGKATVADFLDVKMSGNRVVFEPKPNLQGKELIKQVDRMKDLKKAEAGLNQLIHMWAHLEGTTDYGKVWEANKHILMPGVFPAPTEEGKSNSYGKRADGTEKGKGFFGEIASKDGKTFSTEISVGVNIGGKEMEIPTLVPTLTPKEIDYLVNGGKPTEAIVDKAVAHAKERMKAGKPVFAQAGEEDDDAGGLDVKLLSREAIAYLKKTNPEAFANGVNKFNKNKGI